MTVQEQAGHKSKPGLGMQNRKRVAAGMGGWARSGAASQLCAQFSFSCALVSLAVHPSMPLVQNDTFQHV